MIKIKSTDKKTNTVSIRLTDEQLKKLQTIANKNSVSIGAVIRYLLFKEFKGED